MFVRYPFLRPRFFVCTRIFADGEHLIFFWGCSQRSASIAQFYCLLWLCFFASWTLSFHLTLLSLHPWGTTLLTFSVD